MGIEAKTKADRRKLREASHSFREYMAATVASRGAGRHARRVVGIATDGTFDALLFPTRGVRYTAEYPATHPTGLWQRAITTASTVLDQIAGTSMRDQIARTEVSS